MARAEAIVAMISLFLILLLLVVDHAVRVRSTNKGHFFSTDFIRFLYRCKILVFLSFFILFASSFLDGLTAQKKVDVSWNELVQARDKALGGIKPGVSVELDDPSIVASKLKLAESLLAKARIDGNWGFYADSQTAYQEALKIYNELEDLKINIGGKGESIYVQYRGVVPLDSFVCQRIENSSLVNRICYDETKHYMIISLQGVYYHYCEIGKAIVDNLLKAESKGAFYNAQIKGHFDCRLYPTPEYK